jgi:hypothetical protein
MNIGLVGAELFNVDRQTDGNDEANFANALKNKQKRILCCILSFG